MRRWRRMNDDSGREGSDAASRVLSRSDLQQELAEVLRQRAAISAVLRAIANSPHDLQPIFDTIIDSAMHLCRADWGSFRLVEEAGLRLVAYKRIPPVSGMHPPPTLLEHGSLVGRLYGRLSETGLPIQIPDLATHDELSSAGEAEREGILQRGLRTTLMVPMLRNDELIGPLTIGRRRVEPYEERDRTGHGLRCADCHCAGDHPPRAAASRTADAAGAREPRRDNGGTQRLHHTRGQSANCGGAHQRHGGAEFLGSKPARFTERQGSARGCDQGH